SSGEAGPPEDMPRDEVKALREAEQRAAAEVVGVEDVLFLGHRDGHLQPNLELRRDISRVIRQVRPDVVIAQCPERRWHSIYGSHPDHLATGEATIAAVYPDARNPHAHTELLSEGFEPHAVSEIWVTGLEPVDVFIDITEVIELKCEALSAHSSQVGRFDVDELLRDWGTRITESNGLPEGRLTEAFRKIDAR
ncbi:MAG: PIG-L deacetylase family protein, partial [Acidimicrobiales bacterium]